MSMSEADTKETLLDSTVAGVVHDGGVVGGLVSRSDGIARSAGGHDLASVYAAVLSGAGGLHLHGQNRGESPKTGNQGITGPVPEVGRRHCRRSLGGRMQWCGDG